MENKKKICSLLLAVLQETRQGVDLIDIEYDCDHETVTMIFVFGYKRKVDVTADSGFAMIRDIINNL